MGDTVHNHKSYKTLTDTKIRASQSHKQLYHDARICGRILPSQTILTIIAYLMLISQTKAADGSIMRFGSYILYEDNTALTVDSLAITDLVLSSTRTWTHHEYSSTKVTSQYTSGQCTQQEASYCENPSHCGIWVCTNRDAGATLETRAHTHAHDRN